MYQIKPCKCGSHYIQNKQYWLCGECVFKKNHQGLSRQEYYNKNKKPKKHKITGERKLFLEIWGNSPHYCQKCYKWLGDVPKTYYFSHIKSKGAHPELRLEKSNIELLCRECHFKYEFN